MPGIANAHSTTKRPVTRWPSSGPVIESTGISAEGRTCTRTMRARRRPRPWAARTCSLSSASIICARSTRAISAIGTSDRTNDGKILARHSSQPKTGTIPAFTASSQPSSAAMKKFGRPIVTAISVVTTRSTYDPLASAAITPNGMPSANGQQHELERDRPLLAQDRVHRPVAKREGRTEVELRQHLQVADVLLVPRRVEVEDPLLVPLDPRRLVVAVLDPTAVRKPEQGPVSEGARVHRLHDPEQKRRANEEHRDRPQDPLQREGQQSAAHLPRVAPGLLAVPADRHHAPAPATARILEEPAAAVTRAAA